METLEVEQSDRWSQNANTSFPTEIIEEILSRLPVKSILRFSSVSKPWLSRISDPSFTKLQLTRATAGHRTALFFSAYDHLTGKRYLLSAAHDGGPVTHLMTLDDAYSKDIIQAEHLNGLVCFTCVKRHYDFSWASTLVLNPSTRKMFKLPDPCSCGHGYFFGFDESRNEHKILMIRKTYKSSTVESEIMIFSLSNYSWRKIAVEPPIGFSWDCLDYDTKGSVCVNSVIHLLLQESFDILAFDLRTEKFSIIVTPQGVMSHVSSRRGRNRPQIIKNIGCIGVVCRHRTPEGDEMHIWMLQDYENRVWVKEITTFLVPWIHLDGMSLFPFPLDVINMDEIIFCPQIGMRFSFMDRIGNKMTVPVYNKRTRCLSSLQFTFSHQFLSSKQLKFDRIKCYVESMVPLQTRRGGPI